MNAEEMKDWRKDRKRRWHQGFTLYSGTMIPEALDELCFVEEPEWNALRDAMSQGFTIGIILPGDDPAQVVAEIANRLGVPIRAYYEEPDNMLYVAPETRTSAALRETAAPARKRRSA